MLQKIYHISYLLLTIALMAMLISGCHDDVGTARILDQAEALMEATPDSASDKIKGLDPLEMNADNAARCILLKAQAAHKLSDPFPSDILLTIAVNHYATQGPDSLLMKALFYRSVERYGESEIKNAMYDASKSWETALTVGNKYWAAKSAEQIADLYKSTLNTKEAVQWRKITSDYYKECGRTDNHLFSMCDLIADYGDNGEYYNGTRLIDSLYPVIIKCHDIPTLKNYYYGYSIPLLTYFGDTTKAQSMLDSLKKNYNDTLDAEFDCYQARILMSQNKSEMAKAYLDSARNKVVGLTDKILLLNEIGYYHELSGDYKEACTYNDSVITLQNRLFHQSMAQELGTVQRDFYRESLSDAIRITDRQGRWITLLVISIIAVLLVESSVAIILRRRSKEKIKSELDEILQLREIMKQQELIRIDLESDIARKDLRAKETSQSLKSAYDSLDQSKNQISDLHEQIRQHEASLINANKSLEVSNKEISELRQRILLQLKSSQILFNEKWEMLNMICSEIQSADPDTELVSSRRFKKHIESLRNPDYISRIESEVNNFNDNIVARLREQCSWIKESDICFITLNYAGLNARAVAFFMKIKVNYYYTKRARLTEKILLSKAADKEEFVSMLEHS